MKKTNLKSDCCGKPVIETVDGRYFCGGVNGCGRYCKTIHNLCKSTQNLGNLPKSINCYVEICQLRKLKITPTVWYDKPTGRELKMAYEYGSKYYKAKIIIKDEIKTKKKK